MTPEQREAILSNAKYLKQIRPIDPEEIQQYVEGNPHPSVIRQVLRESAVNLGLVEHDNGTFTPVTGSAMEPKGIVEEFPSDYTDVLLDRLVDRYGIDWYAGDSGDRLREVIRQLKSAYHRGEPVRYDADAAYGYAIYHLPASYAAFRYVVEELIEAELLPETLRILDLGAGVGGPALGLNDLLPDDVLVEYHAVEPSPAADLLKRLLAETSRNFHATVHRETAESFQPSGDFDLISFINVLSELSAPEATVSRYLDSLARRGSLVLVAPADKETSTGLREIERTIVDGLTVFSPTIRLWPGSEPGSQCWSFDVHPDLPVPEFQHRLDAAGDADGEFVNIDVQYSYSILRSDGVRRIEFDPDPGRFAKMEEMDHHVTDRIDLVGIKLSHELGDDGNPLFLVGDGSENVDHYAVLTRETSLNRVLIDADYGSLLRLENVLVLWNEDEGAYNVVVDDSSVIDVVR